MITNKITPEEENKMANEEVQPTGESAETEIAEPGFTPGPWKAVGYSPGWWQIEGPEQEMIADVNYSNGLDEPTLYPEEANARLIAAAPALYEIVAALGDRCTNMYAGQRCPLGFKDSKMWCLPCRARAALTLVDAPKTKETEFRP